MNDRREERRKILIIEDEPAIRNLIRVLLASMGCECTIAMCGNQALAMLKQKSFDVVLLDLRVCDLPTEKVLRGIKEIQPNLIGRVLVINGEVADVETMDVIERHCLQNVPRNRLVQQLWPSVQTLTGANTISAHPRSASF